MIRHAREALRSYFDFEELYAVQERVIGRVLDGGCALVVLPTGSGKSLCYQLPALVRSTESALSVDGVTLVFSPLIALMQDQVSSLRKRGIRAEFINSTLNRDERERRYRRLAAGDYDLIYATPERMNKPEFVGALGDVEGGVRLLAIDEAHCITKWGHDFRPAYQEVGRFREELGRPTTIALTATATPAVRGDIRATLSLDESAMPLFATGIDRPNLSFEVRQVWGERDKLDAIAAIAGEHPGTGIVYFSLIKTLEAHATELRRRLDETDAIGSFDVYHGKLSPQEKKRVYDRFIDASVDERLLLLATNAFGMGVDKPDIRSIIHAEVPGSVESYYQEVGRAGRDGEPSACVLLYDEADLAIQQQFVEWMNPSADLLEEAALVFRSTSHAQLTIDDLRARIIGRDRGDRRAEYCVIALEKYGVIERAEADDAYRFVRPLAADEIRAEGLEAKRERDLMRLFDMLKLVKCDDIRRYVLDYFDLGGSA